MVNMQDKVSAHLTNRLSSHLISVVLTSELVDAEQRAEEVRSGELTQMDRAGAPPLPPSTPPCRHTSNGTKER